MALGSTQPLTEMSTRNISWGKGGRCLGLTTLQPSCADCLKIWDPEALGTLRACNWIALPLPLLFTVLFPILSSSSLFPHSPKAMNLFYIACEQTIWRASVYTLPR